MKKVPIPGGSGRWFDPDSAKAWKERIDPERREDRYFKGGYDEKLYLTEKGSFVLCSWNDWCQPNPLYSVIDPEEATRWLIANGYQSDIPKLELQSEERQLEI
jgi:hypothetical protein